MVFKQVKNLVHTACWKLTVNKNLGIKEKQPQMIFIQSKMEL